MNINCLPTGMFGSNCYIVNEGEEGIIIDPGTDSDEIISVINESGIKIKYIILTHSHIDHICSLDKVCDVIGAAVLVHKDDSDALSDPILNVSALIGKARTFKAADKLLSEGDILEAGKMKIEIMHTPGHSKGSICIKINDCIFTGDTLLRMSIGRTDLGSGNYEDIINSIKNKLVKLDDSIKVYPGHGESTTIGYERRNNEFF